MEYYKLWCTYHREDIPEEYNLYETNNFKLFYNDNFNLEEDNINYLHDYLCDIGTYYYVWKNNLKSDIVGFCQYSKHFNHIDYDLINKFGVYTSCFAYQDASQYLDKNNNCNICTANDYLKRNLIYYFKDKYDINLFDYYNNHKYIYESWHNMYFFKWENFCDVCDYIFGYLDYIFTNGKWKIKSNLDFIMKTKIGDKGEIFSKSAFPKGFSIFFEWAIGLYVGIKHGLNDTNYYLNKFNRNNNNRDFYFITCKNIIDNIDDFKYWLRQNMKSAIDHYVIKSNTLTNDDITKVINSDLYNFHICYNDDEYINKKNDFICSNYKQIDLSINERIKCNTGIEFYKGIYDIEKIK